MPIFDVFDFCNGLSVSDQKNADINLYPNPATDKVNFEGVENGTIVTVYDVFGRIILKSGIKEKSLSISELNTGVYSFVFYVQETKIIKKIIVN